MTMFVEKAKHLKTMRIWSSYMRLEDVDNYMKSFKESTIEYLKAAIKKYFLKIETEIKNEP